ncbi:MAG: chitobiase/beta-hexosaminidase C-terminal domain-containing protein [Allomuricauda sp.]
MRKALWKKWRKQVMSMVFVAALGAPVLWGQSKKPIFLSADEVQLAAPKIGMDSMLFKKSGTLQMSTSQGATIRYTLDGTEVGPTSSEYSGPLVISHTVQLRAMAFHPDYKPSVEQIVNLRKIHSDISSAEIEVNPLPHENYLGTGPKTLINGKKGSINFRNGHDWLGFQTEQVEIDLKFMQALLLEKVVLSVLQDQGSWIFSPNHISINYKGLEIGSKTIEDCGEEANKKMDFIEIPIKNAVYDQLKITVESLDQIPSWHPGKGTKPWLFMDEILVE